MPFTARQLEIVEILKSGVAFLESQPRKGKYSLRDVFTAAGDEIQSANFYAMVKQLKKKKANLELAELRQIFARLNVHVAPLVDDGEKVQEDDFQEVASAPDYLVLESCVEPKPEASHELTPDCIPESCEPKVEIRHQEPLKPIEPVKQAESNYEAGISSMEIILRTLAPLSRTMRMNIIEAAESFYGIGR